MTETVPRCEICDTPLPADARTDARTCSDRCRQALHRRAHVPDPAPNPARWATWADDDPAEDLGNRLGHWTNLEENF